MVIIRKRVRLIFIQPINTGPLLLDDHWLGPSRSHLVQSAVVFQVMEETAKSILSQIPKEVSVLMVMEKFPVRYEQSMNTVLIQEVIRSV